jgi:hypothetical protein
MAAAARRSGDSFEVMRLPGGKLALALAAGALLTSCTIPLAQTTPPPPRPLGEIAREERGEIITVNDTRIDLSTGQSRALNAHTPAIPAGPIGLRVPITLGGEKRVEVPAEEITVQLASGKLISVVQELNKPPFAPGERVRVLYERANDTTGVARTRIVRE